MPQPRDSSDHQAPRVHFAPEGLECSNRLQALRSAEPERERELRDIQKVRGLRSFEKMVQAIPRGHREVSRLQYRQSDPTQASLRPTIFQHERHSAS